MKTSRNAMMPTASTITMSGINHRRDDLVFDLLRFFLELGEPRQHDFEHAAELARFHHVDVEIVKNPRMLREASENVLPPCTESASLLIVFFRTTSRSCFARTLRPRRSGKPESISVASCRVKIIRIFGLTFLRWKENDVLAALLFRPARGALRGFPRAPSPSAPPFALLVNVVGK